MTTNAGWWFIDNSSLHNLLFEATIQTIFWSITLTILRHYITLYCQNKKFYQYASSQEGGAFEFIGWITCIPNHCSSALLIWIGMHFNRNDIFRSAVLSEFGYETFDLVNVYVRHFFFSPKKKTAKDKKDIKLVMYAITFHHLPGILVIVPALHIFGDDIYFQECVWSLLAYTSCSVALIILCKACDINDLNGRTQFTFYHFTGLFLLIYTRFVWLPVTMYNFIVNSLVTKSVFIQILCIFYSVLIYMFNLLCAVVGMQRGYKYMFKTKGKEFEQIKAAKLLKRSSSNLIFGRFIENGLKHYGDKHIVRDKGKKHYSCSNLKLHSSQL